MRLFLSLIISLIAFPVLAQDTAVFKWSVTSKRISGTSYELHFKTEGAPGWKLFNPNEILSDVPSSELLVNDSSIVAEKPVKETGKTSNYVSAIFDNRSIKAYEGPAEFIFTININGQVPSQLIGTMNYTYARGDEFYSLNPFPFTVALEGGVSSAARIKIPSINVKNPVAPCGDENAEGKGLLGIFILGFVGGLIALLTPCVFPLIPLTVSFFTKRAENRKRGVANALTYGFFIFLIYILLSVPFHLLDNTNPEILNNISTNVWLNLVFFVIFIVFAISFFGYFDIALPGSFASKVDSKSGVGNLGGIFFMALTLAIVSFSCTGPILGSLLAGALTNNGGAIQLTFGMGGFGMGLALPFALFAMFPGWLKSLPRSGGWLNTVKVVLGFLEVAMAIKFLSNADLVKQWGVVKREVFIGSWVIIGVLTVLYLLGKIKFPHDSPMKKIGATRWAFIALFAAFTIYLIPGVTNTKWGNLGFISGFPPPLCYSVYKNPVNCQEGIEPLRDYEEALKLAKAQNKPVLIDFTGWACVNCRRMEENVWTNPQVLSLMRDSFIVVSLYVDERKLLPATQQTVFKSEHTGEKKIITVGDKWATFQFENFYATSQPQYAIISPDERALTRTKGYTPSANEFKEWLNCGIGAYKK